MNPFLNLFKLVKDLVGAPINNALRDSQLINNLLSTINSILRGLFDAPDGTTFLSQFAIGDLVSVIVLILIIKFIINLFSFVFLTFKEFGGDLFDVQEPKAKVRKKKRNKAFN